SESTGYERIEYWRTTGAEECFDSQMLLDPLEEEFHLPARFVDLSTRKGRQHEVVGEELQALVGFDVIETHPAQGVRIYLGGLDGGQDHRLIGSNAGSLIHRM